MPEGGRCWVLLWIGSNAQGREMLGTTMDRVKCLREGDVGYYYG